MNKKPSDTEDAEDKRTVWAIVVLSIVAMASQILIGLLAALTE